MINIEKEKLTRTLFKVDAIIHIDLQNVCVKCTHQADCMDRQVDLIAYLVYSTGFWKT